MQWVVVVVSVRDVMVVVVVAVIVVAVIVVAVVVVVVDVVVKHASAPPSYDPGQSAKATGCAGNRFVLRP